MHLDIGNYRLTFDIELTTEPVAITASLFCFYKPLWAALTVQAGPISIMLSLSEQVEEVEV